MGGFDVITCYGKQVDELKKSLEFCNKELLLAEQKIADLQRLLKLWRKAGDHLKYLCQLHIVMLLAHGRPGDEHLQAVTDYLNHLKEAGEIDD